MDALAARAQRRLMASFHAKDGYLYIDFRWRGLRCREATRLEDNKDNRRRVRRTVRQIDGDIAAGTFEYQRWFPRGRKAGLLAAPESNAPPLYAAYVRRWLADKTARLGAGTAYDWREPTDSCLRRAPGFGHRRRGRRGIYRLTEARRRRHAAGTGHD